MTTAERMDRRRFLAVAAGTAAAAGLVGCGGATKSGRAPGGKATPHAGATIRIPGNAFGFPSPFAYNGGPGYWQMSFVYDTLMWKDSTGNLMGWLASSMNRAADDVTYTFKIRPGVTWHDGKPLTAADVAFTFEYFASQTVSPLVVAQPYGVAHVSTSGTDTVVIRTAGPDVTFAEYVAGSVPIVPQHVWSKVKVAAQDMKPSILVGSGPYQVTSYNGNDGAVAYQAAKNYFLGKPFVSRIELIPMNTDFPALQGNQVDVGGWQESGGILPSELAPFRDSSTYAVQSNVGSISTALYFNLAKGGPLADVRFRRAFAMAVNRADLVNRLYGGDGVAGNPGYIPPGDPYYVNVPQYDYDVAGAKALLEGAGYRTGGNGVRTDHSGKPLAFGLLVSTGPLGVPTAELLVNALGAIGVKLTPKAVPPGPQFYGAKMSGQYDVALAGFPGPGGGGPDTDPDSMRRIFSSKAPPSLVSVTGYRNPTFDAIATEQLATFDVSKRKALIAQMQKIVADDLPALTLTYPTQYNIYRRAAFDAWYFTPGGLGPGVAGWFNKQAFITGRTSGTHIA